MNKIKVGKWVEEIENPSLHGPLYVESELEKYYPHLSDPRKTTVIELQVRNRLGEGAWVLKKDVRDIDPPKFAEDLLKQWFTKRVEPEPLPLLRKELTDVLYEHLITDPEILDMYLDEDDISEIVDDLIKVFMESW